MLLFKLVRLIHSPGHFPLVNRFCPPGWMAESLFPSFDLALGFDKVGQKWEYRLPKSAIEARSTTSSGCGASRTGQRGRVDHGQEDCLCDRHDWEHPRFHARTPPPATCCASEGRQASNPLPRLARGGSRIYHQGAAALGVAGFSVPMPARLTRTRQQGPPRHRKALAIRRHRTARWRQMR